MRTFFVTVVTALCLCAIPVQAETYQPDLLEVIEIDGPIGQSTVKEVADRVEQINKNPKVRAVLLVVNSPGGGATASASLYDELSKIKVPVVGWCDYMCASGGVYALMAPSVKEIGVRPQTISGSVGVIMQVTRYNRLLEWAKIDTETYTSGSLKDAANPTRPGNEAERQYLQDVLNTLAEQFYGVVKQARGHKIKDWASIKSARVYVGQEAVKVGLADAVMTREQAIARAKALSGSKLIFTAEEMKAMSKTADQSRYYRAPVVQSSWLDHADYTRSIVDEVRRGMRVTVEYRLPLEF